MVKTLQLFQEYVDESVGLLTETVVVERGAVNTAGVKYLFQMVKSRLLRLNYEHIQYVKKCLHRSQLAHLKKCAAFEGMGKRNFHQDGQLKPRKWVWNSSGESCFSSLCKALYNKSRLERKNEFFVF